MTVWPRPSSLYGAYTLAVILGDQAEMALLRPRLAERFPYGAADQQIVGDVVAIGLIRELFRSYSSEDKAIDTFASSIFELVAPEAGLTAADIAATIRAAIADEPRLSALSPFDRMGINSWLAKAAARQLELPTVDVVQRFVAAELLTADQGVWLAPRDEGTAARPETHSPTVQRGYAVSGPRDATGVDDPREGRMDFGSLLFQPPRETVELRLMEQSGEIVAIEVQLHRTTLQLQVFAAGPNGAWDAVRRELADKTVRGSGTAREIPGIGTELWTQSVDTTSAEPAEIKHMRFIGKDGPGWFCRGVLIWRGRPEKDESEALENAYRQAVVVRGTEVLADHSRLRLAEPRSGMRAADQDTSQN